MHIRRAYKGSWLTHMDRPVRRSRQRFLQVREHQILNSGAVKSTTSVQFSRDALIIQGFSVAHSKPYVYHTSIATGHFDIMIVSM